MKKICFVFLSIFLFSFAVDNVKAAELDEIDYEITSFEVNSSTQKVTIKGWAIIGGHNNFGGVLTNIQLVAKSASKAATYTAKLEYQNTGTTYGDNGNASGNKYCYQRECKDLVDEEGTPIIDEETGKVWSVDKNNTPSFTYVGDCFYRNMYFTATFNIDDLRSLGSGVYFNLTVEYNTNLDKIDKCSVNDSDKATAKNILTKIDEGGYSWGYNESESINITVDENKCSVDGKKCANTQKLTVGRNNIELKITNTDDVFRLHFDKEYTSDPLNVKNVEKSLICQDNMFQSIKEERVNVKVTARYSDGKCSNSASQTISAEYYTVQSGDLMFDLERGPIYSGGNFTFDINYINSVRWYYGDDIDTCPKIYVPRSKWGSYSCHCHRTCSGSGENKKCHRSCSTCYGCVDGVTIYPDNCKSLEDAKKLYEAKIPDDIYKGVSTSNKTVTLPKDSNSVKNSTQTAKVGTWTCSAVEDINGKKVNTSSWSPGVEWIVKCSYTLPKAMLNKKTADVEYNKNYTTNEWIDEGNSYFIPLKWPTGTFPVVSNLKDLSSIKSINWTANYECDVETKQLLYDLDDGGYLFYYRPISLANPFPNRDPSTNWIDWWSNEDNREELMNTYNNLEYKINLSPQDMREIRNYNVSQLKNGSRLGYLDYSINIDGTSNFFRQSYISSGFSRTTSDYSKLGEVRQ